MALSLKELLEKPFVGVQSYIGNGVLPKRGRMLVGGHPAIGKSMLVMNIAYHLASGKQDLFDMRYGDSDKPFLKVHEPVKVLYVEQEVGEYSWKERLELIHGDLKQPLPLDNLFLHTMDFTIRLDDAKTNPYWDKLLSPIQPNVLVLDPFSHFHSCDENSASLMNYVLLNVDKLIHAYGFSVILVHHFHKPNEFGDFGIHRFRGNSAIFAWADTRLEVDERNHRWGELELHWTIRRGKPLHSMNVDIDPDTLVVRESKAQTQIATGVQTGGAIAAKPKTAR